MYDFCTDESNFGQKGWWYYDECNRAGCGDCENKHYPDEEWVNLMQEETAAAAEDNSLKTVFGYSAAAMTAFGLAIFVAKHKCRKVDDDFQRV